MMRASLRRPLSPPQTPLSLGLAALAFMWFQPTTARSQLFVDHVALTKASEIFDPSLGNRLLLLPVANHEVSVLRVGPPEYALPGGTDFLYVAFPSLDLTGGESWALADYGTYLGANAPADPSALTAVPWFDPADPTVPVPVNPPVPVPGDSFYLTYALWNEPDPNPPFSQYRAWGWVHLQLAPDLPGGDRSDDLILLGSASTTDPRGIVVGQYRIVPEPATVLLAGAAAIVAAAGRSLRRRLSA